jgi:hypothetical protein
MVEWHVSVPLLGTHPVIPQHPPSSDDFVPKQSTCSSAQFLVLRMLLTVQVKVSADCLDVKIHHACSHDNHIFALRERGNIDKL